MTAKMNLVMKASEPTDTELVRRLGAGDKDAFAELYRRRQGNVYRFALFMTGRPEVADDVVQETFMTLINRRASYDETKGAVKSFLLGIARNQILNRMRQERATVPVEEVYEAIDQNFSFSGQLANVARRERIEAVQKAILTLPEHYREVVILCELQEMSYAQTAAIMNCAVGTVRSRLHRARAMLAEKLEPVSENSLANLMNSTRCFA